MSSSKMMQGTSLSYLTKHIPTQIASSSPGSLGGGEAESLGLGRRLTNTCTTDTTAIEKEIQRTRIDDQLSRSFYDGYEVSVYDL